MVYVGYKLLNNLSFMSNNICHRCLCQMLRTNNLWLKISCIPLSKIGNLVDLLVLV